ncbi:glycerol-3-phosphate dehydrogenase [Marinomonas sp. M1K-6]|uniref:Glycerol-3-phosphate dehydrogenase n=1 Tax=Marinomonas profundi TaxID=2726122 RepID=A0A847R6R5_9GAMM|nr:glycerol-3-phosphate dehydrogenase [Marinomonas profundi]NLQ17786.1 glycerol-3-phosphate dehydrogenase [Marinomonas profundi]UDV04341.1 glycerol-3-phosphate dehydrogenase [Marinomonas profundi]
MNHSHFDLFVVGGGINGTGIAADAAGRGLTVGLCEMGDLAHATSSSSSKLIHGGLRYLEHYEFRLVKEALTEREVLLKVAPHLVTPMRFQMPHRPHLRPAWLIRIGLFLYDNLGKRETLPASKGVKYGIDSPLKADITQGFEYSDCWVDDARLVVTNALSAQQHGAAIFARTRCTAAKRVDNLWKIRLEDQITKETHDITAKALVNAAGPWVSSFIETKLDRKAPYGIRMIKGSHIVVPKLHSQPNAFIMQNTDKRIVFAIPYREHYTLLGTTDVEYKGDPNDVAISAAETQYILQVANDHFKKTLTPADVVWSYSGVRPLLEDESSDPSAVTRDYTLHLEDQAQHAPLLSIFGGKITTYRKLALSALKKLAPYFDNLGDEWTHSKPLPGGDLGMSLDAFAMKLQQDYPFIGPSLARRFANSYGTLTHTMLNKAHSITELGLHFGNQLYQQEVDYLIQHEWARSAEDILWRRTKLGLEFSAEQTSALEDYIKANA